MFRQCIPARKNALRASSQAEVGKQVSHVDG